MQNPLWWTLIKPLLNNLFQNCGQTDNWINSSSLCKLVVGVGEVVAVGTGSGSEPLDLFMFRLNSFSRFLKEIHKKVSTFTNFRVEIQKDINIMEFRSASF